MFSWCGAGGAQGPLGLARAALEHGLRPGAWRCRWGRPPSGGGGARGCRGPGPRPAAAKRPSTLARRAMRATARLKLGATRTPMRPPHAGLQVRDLPARGADHQVGARLQGPGQMLRHARRRRWRRWPRPRAPGVLALVHDPGQLEVRLPPRPTAWAMAEPRRPRAEEPEPHGCASSDEAPRGGAGRPSWPPGRTTRLRLISLAPMLIISTLMSRRAPKAGP